MGPDGSLKFKAASCACTLRILITVIVSPNNTVPSHSLTHRVHAPPSVTVWCVTITQYFLGVAMRVGPIRLSPVRIRFVQCGWFVLSHIFYTGWKYWSASHISWSAGLQTGPLFFFFSFFIFFIFFIYFFYDKTFNV